ncbi:MAG: SPOR domain-containing protein [Gammaproteobacteria bacterium]|nr:SPOR domain-containing protein [Gammaproteobacteria bacterium]
MASAKARGKSTGRARKSRDDKRGQGSSMSFISGLSTGLLVAFIALLYGQPVREQLNNYLTQKSGGGVAVEPQPSDAKAEPPDYKFYKILPEMEVTVPDWTLDQRPKSSAPALKQGTYLLQVGSFKRFEVADRAKAMLAIRGIEANIQRVVINGQEVWYRVHVGPYRDAEEISAMRARLNEARMDPILLRIGGTN